MQSFANVSQPATPLPRHGRALYPYHPHNVKHKILFLNVFNYYNISDYIFINSGYKNKLLLYKEYTFARMNSDRLYYCSKKKTGCKAKVRMENGNIIYADVTHTHEPPKYKCTSKGEYVRICK